MKARHSRKFIFFFVLLLMLQAHSTNVHLQVNGLSGDLYRNVRARLSTIDSDEAVADVHFQSRVDNAIREGLLALGYYSPTIDFSFKPAVKGGRDVLISQIAPGKPVKIAGVHVILRGEASQDSDYQHWISDGKPELGTVLNHGSYDKFKNGFSSLALRKGYFDAEFRKSQLGVVQSLYQAYWDIDFDSGQRYCFGKVRFHGTQIREDYLQNLAKVHEGEPYSVELLAELNRQLVASNWFSSVIISPKFSAGKQSKRLPLDVVATPRSRNSLETGIGYATNVGPRVKTLWNKPWINSRGHSLQTGLSFSTPEQSIDVSYKIPVLKDPLEQYFLLQGGFKRENLNKIQADSTMLNVIRYWDLSNGWQRAINLRWSLDHFTQDKVTDTTMLLYPGVSINRTSQRGGLMPIKGNGQHYSIDFSNTICGSDVNFIIFQAQNVWIHTLVENHRFVARVNLGWIETNDLKNIPPSLRFFAGGDRSIRGYKSKSLSPLADDNKLMGASKLVTGSLEYQYNVIGKWWGAVFMDSGEVVNNIKQSNFKTGAGIGVRWQSPVGSVKMDIATSVTDKNTHTMHSMQFYIGLGPEL